LNDLLLLLLLSDLLLLLLLNDLLHELIDGRLRRLNDLFNLYLSFYFDVLGDLQVDCERPVGEEELDGDVIIDAEEVACR
jgi:hypothetical protein